MCSGRGTPGNKTTGNGNTGRWVTPSTLSLASLTFVELYLSGTRIKKIAPAVVVGYDFRGLSSTPYDEEGFHLSVLRTLMVGASEFQRICANSSSRCTGINLQILASMSSMANGLAKKPSAPASMQDF